MCGWLLHSNSNFIKSKVWFDDWDWEENDDDGVGIDNNGHNNNNTFRGKLPFVKP